MRSRLEPIWLILFIFFFFFLLSINRVIVEDCIQVMTWWWQKFLTRLRKITKRSRYIQLLSHDTVVLSSRRFGGDLAYSSFFHWSPEVVARLGSAERPSLKSGLLLSEVWINMQRKRARRTVFSCCHFCETDSTPCLLFFSIFFLLFFTMGQDVSCMCSTRKQVPEEEFVGSGPLTNDEGSPATGTFRFGPFLYIFFHFSVVFF